MGEHKNEGVVLGDEVGGGTGGRRGDKGALGHWDTRTPGQGMGCEQPLGEERRDRERGREWHSFLGHPGHGIIWKLCGEWSWADQVQSFTHMSPVGWNILTSPSRTALQVPDP